MSQEYNPPPSDFVADPDAFEVEYRRQLTLLMNSQPNRAREWLFAKCDRVLQRAQALVDSDEDPSLDRKHQLTVEEKAAKREQVRATRTQLEVLQELREGIRDPAIALMFDVVAPLGVALGLGCHEVTPRTQRLLGGASYLAKQHAEQAARAREATEKKTQWMRDLMPTALTFLANYKGTQTLAAKVRCFREKSPGLKKSERQIRSLLAAAIKERQTILDSGSMSNSC